MVDPPELLMTFWPRLLPFLSWPRLTRHSLRKDIIAGITVGLVLIPQALAYATLAGMPPITGLYAALLPAVVGILWGSSAFMACEPRALPSRPPPPPLPPAPGGARGEPRACGQERQCRGRRDHRGRAGADYPRRRGLGPRRHLALGSGDQPRRG